MSKYKKISKQTYSDIQYQYEMLGKDLIVIVEEYAAKGEFYNYNTIKNKASKEKWVKGKGVAITYAQQFLLETGEAAKKREEIKKALSGLGGNLLQKMITEAKTDSSLPTNKNKEAALKSRVDSLNGIKEFMYDVHNILNPVQKIELHKAMIELENMQKIAEEKEIPNENKVVVEFVNNDRETRIKRLRGNTDDN